MLTLSTHISTPLSLYSSSGVEGGLPSYIAARKGAIESGMDSDVLDSALSMAARGKNGASGAAGASSSGDYNIITNQQRREEAKDNIESVLKNVPKDLLADIG